MSQICPHLSSQFVFCNDDTRTLDLGGYPKQTYRSTTHEFHCYHARLRTVHNLANVPQGSRKKANLSPFLFPIQQTKNGPCVAGANGTPTPPATILTPK